MERVQALRSAAIALTNAVAEALPQQYQDRGARGDPLAQAWLEAHSNAYGTYNSLDWVLYYLRQKVAKADTDEVAKAIGFLEELPDDEWADFDDEASSSEPEPAA